MNLKVALIGAVLTVVSLALAGIQHLRILDIYGSTSNKLYFYGAVAVLLIAGMFLILVGLTKEGSADGKTKGKPHAQKSQGRSKKSSK
jgi:hypothetical protein